MKLFIKIILIILFINPIYAQQFCPTEPSREQLDYMDETRDLRESLKTNPTSVTIPILAHIIRDWDGTGGISESAVNSAVAQTNTIFQNTQFTFEVCEFNYIDNDRFYDELGFGTEETDMAVPNMVQGMLNIFFVPMPMAPGVGHVCGWATFPGELVSGRDWIVMDNACALNGSTLPHEVGHYFNLYHTHQCLPGGCELVDGSNCGPNVGDELCDTPADPNLAGCVDVSCNYTCNHTDANGDLYNPDTQNVMSYSQKHCRTDFSPQQINRMQTSYMVDRNYLDTICCDVCPDNLHISDVFPSGHTEYFEAADWITSDAHVMAGADITYDAGNYIELNEGFIAEYGSKFETFLNGCDSTATCEEPTSVDCSIDVLFVIDVSNSIKADEFQSITDNIDQAIADIETVYTDALYAVTQYAGNYGDKMYIEYDFSDAALVTNSISRVSDVIMDDERDDLNLALGLVQNALTANPTTNLLPANTFLNQRNNAELRIVIFTDADKDGGVSSMLPYDNAVTLKQAPYNANITMVHYDPNFYIDEVAAAIASVGGQYNGLIDSNYAGPDGATIPRQYVPYNMDQGSTLNILEVMPECQTGGGTSVCVSECNATASLNISTGIDAQGVPLSCDIGQVDPFWRLINKPPLEPCSSPLEPSINGNAYPINYFNSNGWSNLPGSSVIAPVNGSCATVFGCNNRQNSDGDYLPYIFERSFCVCEDDIVNIDLDASADDRMYLELWDISNNTLLQTMPGNNNFGTAPHNWNINVSLTTGTYALRANLVNTHAVVLGFSISGSITSQSGRQTIIQDTMCCENNTINVRKILDNDCDGIMDIDDTVGESWTFELHNSAGIIVQTATTNINGELFFNNVLAGDYTIVEIPQSGWTFGMPVNGEIDITVSPGSFNIIEFYNCPDDIPAGTCCADPCEFFDRVNAPVLTNAPDLEGCELDITTVALGDCDQVMIDWGDGTVDGPFAPGNVNLTHKYTAPGTYEVVMFVKEIGEDGNACWEGVSRLEVYAECVTKGVTQTPEVVFQNHPNPFTEQTTIEFTLPMDLPVTLSVFDSMGREIATLLETELLTTGTHEIIFDGTDYPASVYYYTIQAGGFFGTQKMTLIR